MDDAVIDLPAVKVSTLNIRQHKGGVVESVETMKTIPATLEAIREYMKTCSPHLPYNEAELASVVVKLYDPCPDNRVGWKRTYVVTYLPQDSDHWVVFGMCDTLI